MSEPKLISPMLDNFAMGDPISDRDGVRCCPAMENGSDEKYIVKIISNPASQSKLDAMILSGAYPDIPSAAAYFKSLADSVIEEANILHKLSQLEGFLPYDKWQLVEMENEAGYDVYLLSKYRRTLAQKFHRDAMTHLEALNLGLDLCAALALCRRSGFLYVDLKPENVYLNNEGAYRIGDIGFINLNSLKYASLPDRYRSAYTAPEVADAFSSLNTSIDIYALGLILYQVFNGGQLPVLGPNGEATLSAPDYADYEMAEIILKACSPDPAERWKDPVEMGQALVSYMQRNGAHNTPIIPVAVPEADNVPQEGHDEASSESFDDSEIAANEAECEAALTDQASIDDHPVIATPDSDGSDIDSVKENITNDQNDIDTSDTDTVLEDETFPGEEDAQVDYDAVSEEVSDILSQADDLLAHPTPDPVVAPEPIEVVLPETPAPEDSEQEDSVDSHADSDDDAEKTDDGSAVILPDNTDDTVSEQNEPDDINVQESTKKARKPIRWWTILLITLGVAAVAVFGYLFYTQYYLQPVNSITIQDNSKGNLTVVIDSEIEDQLLTVVCTDIYGNQQFGSVTDGNAKFSSLKPDAVYNFSLEISGFHRLTGQTTASYTTPPLINIVQFLAVTGTEDGSAILSFTVEGRDSEQWNLSYATAGEAAQNVTFSGHVYTVTGLTLGSEYTFTLTPDTDSEFSGVNIINHTASKVVKPENLRTTGYSDGTLSLSWILPEGDQADGWVVRCYNANGFDKTISVEETTAKIEGISLESDLTVEVTAAGMSVGARADIQANSVVVSNMSIDESSVRGMTLSWDSSIAPENGWILMYTVDGSPMQQFAIREGNSAELPARVPNSTYTFTLTTADGSSVIGGVFDHKTAEAATFSGYGVTSKNMAFSMCKTPSKKNWDRFDVKKSDYTSTFVSGKSASFLIKMNHSYKVSSDKILTLYVIRDKSGNIVNISSTEAAWRKMWYNNYCELDVPTIPTDSGKYTISVYFNGCSVHEQSFTITK